jgi:hypothetical protein
MCPQCLKVSGGGSDDDGDDHGGGLPVAHLGDMRNLRAFSFSTRPNARECRNGEFRKGGVGGTFSGELFQDPALAADLMTQRLRGRAEGRYEGWGKSPVENDDPTSRRAREEGGDAPPGAAPHPLLDSAVFALRLAQGLVGVPDPRRHEFSVTYLTLSPRLRADPDVAMAFVRLHPTNILHVPPELRSSGSSNDDGVWGELWRVATSCDSDSSTGSGAHSPRSSHVASWSAERLATKGLVLRLLDEAKYKKWPTDALDAFAQIFPSLDREIQLDRDVCLQMAAACAAAPRTVLWDRLSAAEWIPSREFWIDLAERHRCGPEFWDRVPAPEEIATDPAVVLA